MKLEKIFVVLEVLITKNVLAHCAGVWEVKDVKRN
jgi:hypothetical protein